MENLKNGDIIRFDDPQGEEAPRRLKIIAVVDSIAAYQEVGNDSGVTWFVIAYFESLGYYKEVVA